MIVSSPLEIPLTVLGWLVYDGIWDILSETGLVWLPFLFLLAGSWIHARTKMDDDEASMTTLRIMENRGLVMLSVVVLAAQPVFTVNITGLSFSKQECAPGDPTTTTTVAGGSTGTTYDTVFNATTLGGETARVPIWWYGVLAVSSGITNAAIASLPCSPDLRGMQYRMDMTRIADDPDLLRETGRFMRDCYFRARNRFLQEEPAYGPGTAYPEVTAEDLDWMGSWFFLNVDGYYNMLWADGPVKGFAVDPTRLSDMHAIHRRKGTHPPWGYPSCLQWWHGDGAMTGLKGRLLAHVDPHDDWNQIERWAAAYLPDTRSVEDQLLRQKLIVETPLFQTLASRGMASGYNTTAAGTTAAVSWFGAQMEKMTFYPKVFMIREATRNIQAVLLMTVCSLLPFVMVLSGYSFTKLVLASIGVFAIKFMGFLWALCFWLDNHLIDSLRSAGIVADVTTFSVSKQVIDFVSGASYIALPVVWLVILGWAGFSLGSDISSVGNKLSETAASAGEKGGLIAKNTATNIASKGMKGKK